MIENHSASPGPGRPKDPVKREAILAAAQVLFLGNGYEGSSMEAIAAEAGVSKLTLYSHFKDKEALFSAAVKATCETRLPRRLFQLDADCDIEEVLLAIGRAFNELVNSPESIGLHRVMVAMATQNPSLVKMFFDAGPQQLLSDLQQLFSSANTLRLLDIDDPLRAAEHFCSLIKGAQHFRMLVGYAEAPTEEESNLHVRDVVTVFLRAYRG
ncbi:TetR/AcrR family transcriptional regulator [Stutzerimonas decontaminans]|jgi:TetR/AcrR family transcriptional repressor of mexJK operon|uniref:TetR/AcrR family transcriptional regulator n=2 Tax=Stutzerimonas TaxID=2901164 RepID=A0ABX4W2C2_9GAMM|nr:TetR/AcrR family transcriptional regulator [Stutzerimonas decontaminans]AHY42301.1 TetR family transcriptional regulator [Stutzerimonas decontaminans]MCQ4246128.1 TetR/AcrR family transcriptional regulator [Stutzerimonas decontaminans]PNF86597.1 TetR/AcrR family transcriptional regulator [Stutzerimonas decontaminans]